MKISVPPPASSSVEKLVARDEGGIVRSQPQCALSVMIHVATATISSSFVPPKRPIQSSALNPVAGLEGSSTITLRPARRQHAVRLAVCKIERISPDNGWSDIGFDDLAKVPGRPANKIGISLTCLRVLEAKMLKPDSGSYPREVLSHDFLDVCVTVLPKQQALNDVGELFGEDEAP